MKTLLTLVLCSIFFVAGAQTKPKKATGITVTSVDTVKTVKASKVLMVRLAAYQSKSKSLFDNYKNQAANLERQFNGDVELAISQDAQKIPVTKIKKATLNKDSTITIILKL